MTAILDRIGNRPRILLAAAIYGVVLIGSLWLAYLLRFEFKIPPDELSTMIHCSWWIIPFELLVLIWVGQCAGLLSYFSVPDLWRLFSGLLISSAAIMIYWHINTEHHLPPRSVLLANFIFAFGGLSAMRLCFRYCREQLLSRSGRPQNCKRVGVIGAGDVGASLVRELIRNKSIGMAPVAFFDDNRAKWRSQVHNIPVLGAPELLADSKKLKLDEVVIAMPSAPAKRIKEIVRLLQGCHFKFTTVPSLEQLATGRVSVSSLRQVEIEDLLGREPVTLEKENIELYLKNRVVMVTGAGGSIGSELSRQVAGFQPAKLLLVDQSEVQLFQIEQQLVELGYKAFILPLVCDVFDSQRLRQIFRQHRPHVIFHAAAHKHVPMMENQPAEAIKNNTFASMLLAQMAVEYKVDRFVMISTDKAVNPTSVMGATKRMSELYVQALHASHPQSSKLMAVRFGNVLGSSGSVVPVFKQQIAKGGPVTVTHPHITRYFMTIPEAASLVLQSGALGKGGEIFVLDMGKPVKIADLAAQLIVLSGFRPGADIEIEYVGLRPGEKLFEELQQEGENLAPTNHPKILRFISEPRALSDLSEELRTLQKCVHEVGTADLKQMIKQIVPEYSPYLEQNDKMAAAPGENATIKPLEELTALESASSLAGDLGI